MFSDSDRIQTKKARKARRTPGITQTLSSLLQLPPTSRLQIALGNYFLIARSGAHTESKEYLQSGRVSAENRR
jgi:hypothetical protein